MSPLEGAAPPERWPVLVVDDDRCVLEVTRLALGRVQVDGHGLALELCASAAQARALLAQHSYAVAIIDVMMETERAGLDLVRDLRSDPRHRFTQVVVRTGEPGAYPEARVIEDFAINDYWPKTELRANRMRASIAGLLRSHAMALSLDAKVREREVLLRELHHRVRNNLQVLASLLSLQGESANEAWRRGFDDAAARVQAMALVHQQLHAHDTLALIDLHAYLEMLGGEYAQVVGAPADVRITGARAEVDLEVAVPAGLILNELVGVACREGRGPDALACVRISVSSRDGIVLLRVENDHAPAFDAPLPHRDLGQHLVRALARQLRARLTAAPDTFDVTLAVPVTRPASPPSH